ncbi:pilus assembly protein N-terminal domain-containing protein [Bradyrhizobium sp. 2TAF24]|uniref:pilus assembly protein N-terminal domain-containing protein n=1 Tax=Bradyrhizobium sp. 2TAF24 TaxID=3233011 RepID=UPI003F92FC1A
MVCFGPQWSWTSVAVLGVAAALPLASGAARAVDTGPVVTVALNEARLVELPKGARRIILGSPVVVRALPLPDGGHAVLTGTAFGETNMMVLDGAGLVLRDSRVRVEAQVGGGGAVVQRGTERMSYSCADQCQPVLQLGDTARQANDLDTQVLGRNGQAAAPSAAAKPAANRIVGKDGAL